MENSMINKVGSIAFSLVLLVCAPLTQAGMLTFDDLDLKGAASTSMPASFPNYAGFIWDEGFSLGSSDISGFSAAASSGTQFLFNSNQKIMLSVRRETPFDFFGASFGFKSSDEVAGIKFLAYVESEDGIYTKTSEIGYLDLNFSGLTQLEAPLAGIHKLVIVTYGGTFAMDNFSFRDAAVKVTEAGSLALLVIGLIGLWAARRRGQLQA